MFTVKKENTVYDIDEARLEDYLSKGFTVIDETPEDENDETPGTFDAPEWEALKAMSVDGLKAYAAAHNINLGKATSESGVLEKIREYLEKRVAE